MTPSPVPRELQGLTQFQEVFIARAFPAMHVYTKPRGGQKACKEHVITLPQDVQQFADILPRFPKDLPVTVFIISGKKNDSKDFIVRKKLMLLSIGLLVFMKEENLIIFCIKMLK